MDYVKSNIDLFPFFMNRYMYSPMTKTAKDVIDPLVIGQRLIAFRAALGIEQKEFAAAIGVGGTTYNNWELGKSSGGMPIHGALRIYREYTVSPNFFYIGDPDSIPKSYRKEVIQILARMKANSSIGSPDAKD